MRVGGFQQLGIDNDSLEMDRRIFLIIARQLGLRIMDELSIGPFQHYEDLVRNYALNQFNGRMPWEQFLAFLPDWQTVESEAKTATSGSPLLAFRQALLDWSVRWHLDADWCRDRAIAAIRLWRYSEAARRYYCWDSLDLWSCVQERLKKIEQLSTEEQDFVRSLATDPAAFGINVSPPKSKTQDKKNPPFSFDAVPRPKSKLLPRNILYKSLKDYREMARKHLQQEPSLLALSEDKRRKTISKILDGPGRTYHRLFEHHLKSLGWQQARQQPERLKYLIWAAWFQINQVECSQIADGPPLVERTFVIETISRVLRRLGLRNRKRKTPSRSTPKASN